MYKNLRFIQKYPIGDRKRGSPGVATGKLLGKKNPFRIIGRDLLPFSF